MALFDDRVLRRLGKRWWRVQRILQGRKGDIGTDGSIGIAGVKGDKGDAGSDPWQVVRLASDATSVSLSFANIGLAVTPAANTRYLVEAHLHIVAAGVVATPRVGITWPTGLVIGSAIIEQTNSAGGLSSVAGNIAAALQIPGTLSVPASDVPYPCRVRAYFLSGASPAGDFQLQVATSNVLSTATVKADSCLLWRVVP